MAVVEHTDPQSGKLFFTALSTDTKPSGVAGTWLWETDTDYKFECYDDTNWVQIGVNGAERVARPNDNYGTLSVGEVPTPATTAAETTVNFGTGLLGVTIDFHAGNDATHAATELYVAFNNTAFNDVSIAGLRRIVPLGKTKTFSFDPGGTLPTSMTTITDVGEATLADTVASWEAAAN